MNKKFFGLSIVSLIHLLIIFISVLLLKLGVFDTKLFHDAPFLVVLLLQSMGVLIIFIFSLILKNYKIINLFIGICPFFMALLYAYLRGNINESFVLIILIITFIYMVRYILYFYYTFISLKHNDEKIIRLQEKFKSKFFFVNLFIIHILPAIITFIAILPAFLYIEFLVPIGGAVKYAPTIATIFAIFISVVGIVIIIISDIQLISYRNKPANNGLVCEHGLWKISRHPNYFGEIVFWLGIYLMLSSLNTPYWVLFISPVFMLLYYSFIVIPINEKYMLSQYAAYQSYKKKTNMLLIYPPRKVD